MDTNQECDVEDVEAIFKRNAIVLFTEKRVFIRAPGEEHDDVPFKHYPWPEKKDLLTEHCKPTMAAYKKGGRVLPQNFKVDMDWSVQLLRRVLKGEPLPKTLMVTGTSPTVIGRIAITERKPFRDAITYLLPLPKKKGKKDSLANSYRTAGDGTALTRPAAKRKPKRSPKKKAAMRSTMSESDFDAGSEPEDMQPLLGLPAASSGSQNPALTASAPLVPATAPPRFCGTEEDWKIVNQKLGDLAQD